MVFLKVEMLVDEIINNWKGSPYGKAISLETLAQCGYESWTVKTTSEYGVAFPIKSDEEISEYFAGAHYYTGKILLAEAEERDVILLTTNLDNIRDQFACLCAELINPGENGELRNEIVDNPLTWWMQWKELLGNKNVDLRAYDVLGELWTLKYLAEHGVQAEWNGPDGATYDLDCDEYYVEVKSTTARNKRQITLSNLFQLDPPEGKHLYLILCQFEAAQSGVCINDMIIALEKLGYNPVTLNQKLAKLGLEKGKTARKRNYIIHAATKYAVDERFPAIRDSSFIGGVLPDGVMGITYTVTLDGIIGQNLLKDGE